ncbi:hypothetical protein KA082_03435, partial [Candidatus Woesebacteria bacterium]|nr:hypothetical protein [Candidatus Woesebacteria bacterium]
QEKVDAEVLKLIDEGKRMAMETIKKYRKQLDAVSEKLLEVESLDTDEFEKLMGQPKAKHGEKKE